MNNLRNYHHDFPRLAKQSGYFFQLHRGKVNWLEIKNLNVNDIIENKNFQLLEQNLLNVVNFDLERDYDLKILDENFVKLFKLAQLGVDYLSYCQLYLDQCVVFLQDKLIAFQEECATLKQHVIKKEEEIKKIKKRNKTPNYQCEKCEKIFISEVYLQCHDKRRHSIPNTPQTLDRTLKISIDRCLQTDQNIRKVSTCTQTATAWENSPTRIERSEKGLQVNEENNSKIENLEKELKDLEGRLKKAETALTERVGIPKANHSQTYNFPGQIFYPPMLPLVPSYLQRAQNGCYEIPQGSIKSIIEPHSSNALENLQEPDLQAPIGPIISLEKSPQNNYSKKLEEKTEMPNNQISHRNSFKQNLGGNFQYKRKTERSKKKLYSNKENMNPKTNEKIKERIPREFLPNLKNTKKKPKENLNVEEAAVEVFSASQKENHLEQGFELFNSNSITGCSTPIKESANSDKKENLEEMKNGSEEINKSAPTTITDLNISNSAENRRKSLVKKIVIKNSPKLQELSKNLKKSLTNLYDSVSSASGKDKKVDAKIHSNSRTEAVNGLNYQLKILGVDPDWLGIPKKTMKQKIKALRHQRKLFSKGNPMYPAVREGIERRVLRKLNKGSLNADKINLDGEGNESEVRNDDCSQLVENKLNVLTDDEMLTKVKSKTITTMYDVESDTDTGMSDSERKKEVLEFSRKSNAEVGNETIEEMVEREFDLSVFQVNRESNRQERENQIGQSKIIFHKNHNVSESDSDFEEGDLLNAGQMRVLNAETEIVAEKLSDETSCEEMEDCHSQFSVFDENKTENQSILKGPQGIQLKSQTNCKKKVLFADFSKNHQSNDVNKIAHQSDESKNKDYSSESEWE